MAYGDNYASFLHAPASAEDPFPNPANDAQRTANARARAERAGTPIGSGYLNPESGELQDPDRGFMRVIGENPWLGAAIALGPAAPFALGGLGGAASATSSVIPGTGIPTVAGTGGGSMGGGLLGLIGKGLGFASKGADVLQAIGGVTSGAAQGSANQRLAENQGRLSQQGMALQGSRDQFNAGLSSAQFQQQEQERQRKAAILTALLKGTQDQTVTPGNPLIAARMPKVTGGARPSNLTGNAEALLQLLAGGPIAPPTYTPPPQFELDDAGLGENILGGVGLGSSILGAIGPMVTKRKAAA